MLAADSASFQLPGAKNGGFCHTPLVAVAERSERLALEMALMAEEVSASRAERCGLVTRLLPRQKLYGEARRIAEQLAAADTQQMQRGKQTFYEQREKRSLSEKYLVAEKAMLEMFATPQSQAMVRKFRR